MRDRIERLWPKTPSTVTSSTTVGEVLRKMVSETIGCVMIVDEGKLVGIFSERDALMKVHTQIDELGDRPVSEFMTASVETLLPSAKIAFAVHRMDLGGYRHVPIVDENGVPTGMISVRDILSYLTERMIADA